MKRFLLALALVIGVPGFVQGATETINARVLPTIWYSSLTAQAGDTVVIYAGIQNDSGIALTGTADFYVDGAKLTTVPFQSKSGSVERISAPWQAVAGQSSVVVKVVTECDATKSLVSYESDTSHYKVERKLTAEVVTEIVKDTARDVITTTTEKLDTVTADLSTQLETYKKPETVTAQTEQKTNGVVGRVLGAATVGNSVDSEYVGSFIDKARNMGVNALQFLLLKWRWTLAGLGVLALAFVFLKK